MLHFTEGGKHTEGQDTTSVTADVTCGNCKRTKTFQRYAEMAADAALTGNTIHALNDAGFFVGGTYHYRNFAAFLDFYVSYVDRNFIGVHITSENSGHESHSFGDLTAFLRWLTPKDMNVDRIISHVTDSGMTWVEAMDLEWSLAAEVKSVETIESTLNRAVEDAIAEDAETSVKPFRTAGKVKNTRQARRFRKGA